MQDVRHAARMLRKNPAFTAVGVLALGLGIGANTAIFSFVYGLLLRPLAFRDLNHLALVWETIPDSGDRSGVSPANFFDWDRQNHVFERTTFYRSWDTALTAAGESERVDACQVSQEFFRVLEVKAALGRTLLPEEYEPGRDQVVVLSYGLWRRLFNSDPQFIRRTIELGGRGYTIVGVLPPDLDWPIGNDVWSPLALTDKERQERQERSLAVLGRIKPNISLSEAQAEMGVLGRRLAQQYPATNEGWGVKLARMPGEDEELTRSFLLVLMGAAAFVLLVACANVASLQLARAIRRQKEIALRTALGASRWRLIRQVLTESMLLSLLGGTLAVVVALLGVSLIKANVPAAQARYVPGFFRLHVGAAELAFALGAALFTSIFSGLAPAVRMSRLQLNETLKEAGRSMSAGSRSLRLHSLLVVCQLALALILMAGTGSMVSGFSSLADSQRQDFDPSQLLTLRVALPLSSYPTPHHRAALYTRILDEAQALPAVRSAAAVSLLPASADWRNRAFSLEVTEATSRRAKLFADVESASAGYFHTMGIPLLEGREFAKQDGEQAPPVALISKSMAQRFRRGQDPIGRRLKLGPRESANPWLTIIGVVGDVKQFVLDPKPPAKIYVSSAQSPDSSMSLIIRTAGEPDEVAPGVRALLATIDPKLPVSGVKPMDEFIDEQAAGISIASALVGSFGFVALILAAVGIYSLMAYSTSQRTHEMGIRMALGAQRGDVMWMVLWDGLQLGLAGVGIGLAASLGLTRLLAGFLYGAVPADAGTLAVSGTLLTVVVLGASYIPACRATKVDPVVTLRVE
jgi:putative ABC transport system permease protein